MVAMQNKIHDEGKVLEEDPRISKRVICRSLLPAMTLMGTIQRIVQYTNGMESWKVLTDGPIIEEGPPTSFILYEGPEFRAGEQVKYRLDEGGYWLATVVKPLWSVDHLRFLIRVDDGEHAAVKVERGHRVAVEAGRLTAI